MKNVFFFIAEPMPILSKDSERREQYILHAITKTHKLNMAQKKGAALTNRALGL